MGKDEMRVVREALLATDCDRGKLKLWQKKYDHFIKQFPQVKEQYQRARTSTLRVEELAQRMDKLLVQEGEIDKEGQKAFTEALKELKRLQGGFANEFIISREDKEFHSTYESILKLGTKALEEPEQRLILQSEVENLLSLLKENLLKDKPEMAPLCFFYQSHTDKELVDLPPAERLARIAQVYKEEFYAPIEELLLIAIPLADSRMDALLMRNDRKSRNESELLGILWNRPGEQRPAVERAEWLIGELLR
ncbi:MAG: hypothetical protein NC355_08915 [Blautia sp.]|nr:hypothetical protein [Blautia sp.]